MEALEIREIGKNHLTGRKIKTLLEPPRTWEIVKFGGLGDPGHTRDSRNSGNREIGENRYMLEKWETLRRPTRGETTNWNSEV